LDFSVEKSDLKIFFIKLSHLGHFIMDKTPLKADSMDFSVENSDSKIIFRKLIPFRTFFIGYFS
tara:strand:- start:832 stop:1023 length:192 start_codon:yes stop_codon:yes gene_type:complete